MINNKNSSPIFGLGGPVYTPNSSLFPNLSNQEYAAYRSVPTVKAAQGKEISDKIKEIAEHTAKIDPTILAQFPEISSCVDAYFKHWMAERKVVEIGGLIGALYDNIDDLLAALKIYSGDTEKSDKVKTLLKKDMANIVSDVKTLIDGNGSYDWAQAQPKKVVLNLKKYGSLNEFTGDKNTDKRWQFPATDAGYADSAQKLWPMAMIYDRVFSTHAGYQVQSHEIEYDKGYTPLSLEYSFTVPKQLIPVLLPNGSFAKYDYNKAAIDSTNKYMPVFGGIQVPMIEQLYKKQAGKYEAKSSKPGSYGKVHANASLQSLLNWGIQSEGILESLIMRANIVASLINPYTEQMEEDFNKDFIDYLGIPAEVVIWLIKTGKANNIKDLIKSVIDYQKEGWDKGLNQLKGFYYKSLKNLQKAEDEFSATTSLLKKYCGGLPIDVQGYASDVAKLEAYAEATANESDVAVLILKYKNKSADEARDASEKLEERTEKLIALDKKLQKQIVAVKQAKASGDPQEIIAAEAARAETKAEIATIVDKRIQLTQKTLDAARATAREGNRRQARVDVSEESADIAFSLVGKEFMINVINVNGKKGKKTLVITGSDSAKKKLKYAKKQNKKTTEEGQKAATRAKKAVELVISLIKLTGVIALTPHSETVAHKIVIPTLSLQEKPEKGFPWLLLLAAAAAAAGAPVAVPVGLAAMQVMGGKKEEDK